MSIAMDNLSLEELNRVANIVANQAYVILEQRDSNDPKMDNRSALLHRLWARICAKVNMQAGGYPNYKEDATHEKVLVQKIRSVLDSRLVPPMSDQEYSQFLTEFLHRAIKEAEQ